MRSSSLFIPITKIDVLLGLEHKIGGAVGGKRGEKEKKKDTNFPDRERRKKGKGPLTSRRIFILGLDVVPRGGGGDLASRKRRRGKRRGGLCPAHQKTADVRLMMTREKKCKRKEGKGEGRSITLLIRYVRNRKEKGGKGVMSVSSSSRR